MSMPYVVGQWVRGDRFYGRRAHLQSVLAGDRAATWLLGGRRVGKTSLLRQLELLAEREHDHLVPLYWDLQGAENPEELGFTFEEAVLDGGKRLEALGARELASCPPAEGLALMVERLAAGGRTLLLLCDEAEELVALAADSAGVAEGLRQVMGGLRAVLAASVRLRPVAEHLTTLHLGPLEPDEARSLVQQDRATAAHRPRHWAHVVEAIRSQAGDHPYLLQLLAKRTVELGGFEHARAAVAVDPMVEHFFAVDMALLSEADRELLQRVASGRDVEPIELEHRGELLAGLGYLRFCDDGRVEIRGGLLRDWLLVRSG